MREGGSGTVQRTTKLTHSRSLLTKILRESFEREEARLSIIATAAPNATDTEHTMETLKTVARLVGMEGLIRESCLEVGFNSGSADGGFVVGAGAGAGKGNGKEGNYFSAVAQGERARK